MKASACRKARRTRTILTLENARFSPLVFRLPKPTSRLWIWSPERASCRLSSEAKSGCAVRRWFPAIETGRKKRPHTIRDGWLHSGDIAYKDEDGFFFIVDRTKDLIIRGGMNVYPREVEEAMIKHDAVSLVAVIGIPDEKMGEEVKAVVVLKEEITVTETELIEWTKERIATYKCPRQIEFVKALPMSATGKILKKELRS